MDQATMELVLAKLKGFEVKVDLLPEQFALAEKFGVEALDDSIGILRLRAKHKDSEVRRMSKEEADQIFAAYPRIRRAFSADDFRRVVELSGIREAPTGRGGIEEYVDDNFKVEFFERSDELAEAYGLGLLETLREIQDLARHKNPRDHRDSRVNLGHRALEYVLKFKGELAKLADPAGHIRQKAESVIRVWERDKSLCGGCCNEFWEEWSGGQTEYYNGFSRYCRR